MAVVLRPGILNITRNHTRTEQATVQKMLKITKFMRIPIMYNKRRIL